MRRLFLLAKSSDDARALIERLRQEAPLNGAIKLTGATPALANELGVQRGSIEEFTGVRMGRRRGAVLGAIVGIALSLFGLLAPAGSLPLEPWLAITLAAIAGGALGLAFGTIVGSAQRHPIYEAHRRELQQGALLVTVETNAHDVDAVVRVARQVDPDLSIQARTLTDDLVEID